MTSTDIMEHIDRQALYFSLNLAAALTSLATELALMAWVVGLSDGSAAIICGRLLLIFLLCMWGCMALWRMPRKARRMLLMGAAELWSFTAVAAVTLFLGFAAVCAGC